MCHPHQGNFFPLEIVGPLVCPHTSEELLSLSHGGGTADVTIHMATSGGLISLSHGGGTADVSTHIRGTYISVPQRRDI
jgi:hypothetical protein